MQTTIPQYNTKLFTQIYDNATSFLNDWKTSGLYSNGLVADTSITKLYYLLYARYGNNAIANLDETQFKYKLWATIFQYAPTWEKELDIQTALRGLALTDGSDIYKGTRAIYNHSYNPSSAPNTDTDNPLPTIDDQNTTQYRKSKLEGLNALEMLLKSDVTEAFINKFRKLFIQFAIPCANYIYED